LKSLFVLALVVFVAALIVMAVVFRSPWARNILRTSRNAMWIYILVIVLAAGFRLWQQGYFD
jgi:multisubunit Na+/H+ antiporter MnhB subunit